MPELFAIRRPVAEEDRVFASLAAEAASLGLLLLKTCRIQLGRGTTVDLALPEERDLLRTALRAAAAQHLDSGADLLTLLERLDRMAEVSIGKRDPSQRIELGIQLLRAMVVCELLQYESRERFSRHLPLRALAADTTATLAGGYVRALGAELPRAVKRIFPRFARCVEETARSHGVLQPSLLQRCLARWGGGATRPRSPE